MTGVRFISVIGAMVFLTQASFVAKPVVGLFVMDQRPESQSSDLLAWANSKYSAGKLQEAQLIAMEVYEQALEAPDLPRVVQSSLLISRIQLALGHRYESLEFALRGLSASKESSPEYVVSSYLTLIYLFHDWDLSDKVLENVAYVENNALLDATTKCTLLNLKAIHAERVGKYDQALQIYFILLEMAAAEGDGPKQSEILTSLSRIELECKNVDEAINVEKSLLKGFVNGSKSTAAAVCANNLGLLYGRKGDFDRSVEAYRQALSLSGQDSLAAGIMLNMATALGKLHLFEEAQVMCKRVINYASQSNNVKMHCEALTLNSWILEHLGKQALALEFAMKASQIAENYDLDIKPELYRHLAGLCNKEQRYADAQKYIQLATKYDNDRIKREKDQLSIYQERKLLVEKEERLLWARITGERQEELEMKQSLLDAENKDKTLALLQSEKQLNESELEKTRISRESAKKELALAQAELQKQISEKTIIDLERNKSQQDLTLAQAKLQQEEQEKNIIILESQNLVLDGEKKLQQTELEKKQLTVKVSVAGGGLALALLTFLLFAYRSTKRKKQVIETQNNSISMINEQLSRKNHEITDSIEYASYLQRSLVPVQDTFKLADKKSLLLYWPLETVSGDLPFALLIHRRLYVAAIDCIGHGVPAAMLSFMVYYNLKELLENNTGLSCGELLIKLDQRIVETMSATNTDRDYRSAVDMSLVEIDLDSHVVQFSGAGHSLIVLDEKEVRRIKGNVESVCDNRHSNKGNFNTVRIELKRGNRIFMLTDGFIHQLSGSNGQGKFSYKRLMNTLFANRFQSISGIGDVLKKQHDEWKGDTEQTDDILIMGLEL